MRFATSVKKSVLIFVTVGLLSTPALAEENASNPLAAANNTDVRYQAFNLGGSDRQDAFIDGAFMLRDNLKMKYELHYNSTDVAGTRQTGVEKVMLKAIYFPSEKQLNDTWGVRTAIGLEWTLDLGDTAMGVKPVAKEVSRDRVLGDDEIRLFWQACEDLGQPWGPLGKVLLLTGQRLGEAVGMTDSEITGQTWHLTSQRTKNKRAHDVPLSDAVLVVLGGMERIKSDAEYFHTTTGKTPVSGFAKGRDHIANRMVAIASEQAGGLVEIPHWTFHDLRRTAATGMARLGIPVRVTEAVLNHISGTGGGIVAVYQRHDYADEKRNALDAWARFVAGLVEGRADNVVRIGEVVR